MNTDADRQSSTAFPALPPIPVTLTIAGQPLELTPIRVGELPGFIRAIRPFVECLAQTIDWLELFAEHGESLLDALTIASRRPKDWIATLALDDAIELSDRLLEINTDFFTQRVAPAVQRIGARLATRSMAKTEPMPGPAPSTDCCAPDTAIATS